MPERDFNALRGLPWRIPLSAAADANEGGVVWVVKMVLQDDERLPFWFEGGRGSSDRDLADAEAYVDRALPESFRELLRECDGGVSNYAGFEDGATYLPLLPILGVDSTAAIGTIQRAFDVRDTFGVPDGVVPFAAQGNAWWGFDYRSGGKAPSIVYSDEPGTGILEAAANFEAFVAGLVE